MFLHPRYFKKYTVVCRSNKSLSKRNFHLEADQKWKLTVLLQYISDTGFILN